jgi:hypothetical protein
VSHSTAAALWGWPVDESLHLIRPGGRLHAGLTEHRLTLGPHETVVRHGIRITTLPRTVTDILAGFDADSAVAALAEGFRRGVFEPAEVIGAARHAAGRTGAVRARHVAWTCRGGPWSFLEWEFHQVAWSIDPDGWRFNVPIRDGHGLIGVVDAMHEPTGTVVELDGRAFHQDRFQQDRSRDQRLAALGLLSVRFTHADMRVPLAVAAQLRTILATRQRGAACRRASPEPGTPSSPVLPRVRRCRIPGQAPSRQADRPKRGPIPSGGDETGPDAPGGRAPGGPGRGSGGRSAQWSGVRCGGGLRASCAPSACVRYLSPHD